MTDQTDLLAALEQARIAGAAGDHPYGSVIHTSKGTLAERNRVESTPDPTAHSETMALRAAALAVGAGELAGLHPVDVVRAVPDVLRGDHERRRGPAGHRGASHGGRTAAR